MQCKNHQIHTLKFMLLKIVENHSKYPCDNLTQGMHFTVYFLTNDKKPGSSNNLGKNFNNMLCTVPADILKKSSKLLAGCISRPTWDAFRVLIYALAYTKPPQRSYFQREYIHIHTYTTFECLIDKFDPLSGKSLQIMGDEISIAYDTKTYIFYIFRQYLNLTDRFNKLD